jgi:hypothetical protein
MNTPIPSTGPLSNPAAAGRRRGMILLLVMSMLTIFMMLGVLMLTLTARSRESARAFAEVTAGGGESAILARRLLDEALLSLVRGGPDMIDDQANDITESLLGDRYGNGTPSDGDGTLEGLSVGLNRDRAQNSLRIAAAINGNPSAGELVGRVVTIEPNLSVQPDAVTVSYRIIGAESRTGGYFLTVADIRPPQLGTLPTGRGHRLLVNGGDFQHEASDSFGQDAWLSQVLTDASGKAIPKRPAFGSPNEFQVDNDNDGLADGIWLTNVLPDQPSPLGGEYEFEVSYLVIDLDGKININAHGEGGGSLGPGAIDAAAVVDGGKGGNGNNSVWNRVRDGGGPPGSRQPSDGQKRPPPFVGGDGRLPPGQTKTPRLRRLDLDGPRPAALESGGAAENLFTYGELERVLRQFDRDAATLPPRLAALLDERGEASRLKITTDSWDTPGLTGATAKAVATKRDTSPPPLPLEVAQGLRFDLNAEPLADDKDKQAYCNNLYEVAVAAGAPAGQETARWAANVVDFLDEDSSPTDFKLESCKVNVTGYEPPADGSAPFAVPPNQGKFASQADLLGVPKGSKDEIEQLLDPQNPAEVLELVSLAAEHPQILEATTVTPQYESSVFIADPTAGRICRWRTPGLVNVNTCDNDTWEAVSRMGGPNPFTPAPARRDSDVLLREGIAFNDGTSVVAYQPDIANQLATAATVRSNVFAIWITLKIHDTSATAGGDRFHRLFAIVDRSIPVGYSPGENLNVADTIRLKRVLE